MTAPKPGGFEPTHVLAYEEGGRMREVLVRMSEADGDGGQGLVTKDEWAAHSVPDWTFESDGRLYFCGVDFAAERGKCSLRAAGSRPIPLDTILMLVRHGQRSFADIARACRCTAEEVATGAATLERMGELTLDPGDRASPVWHGADED